MFPGEYKVNTPRDLWLANGRKDAAIYTLMAEWRERGWALHTALSHHVTLACTRVTSGNPL